MKTYLLTDEMQVIGRAGESDIAIAVDVAEWITDYPDGVGGVLCERPDGKYVPVTSEVVQNKLVAELPPECVSRPGVYTYTVTWNEASIIRMSHVYKTIILSTANGQGRPDCPYTPAWATQVFAAAEQVNAALDASMQIMADGCVRCDTTQTLSGAEKLRARLNIDAAYQEDVDDLGNYITTKVPGLPSSGGVIADGKYQLKATVTSGTPAYSWGTDLTDFDAAHFPATGKLKTGSNSVTANYGTALGKSSKVTGEGGFAQGEMKTVTQGGRPIMVYTLAEGESSFATGSASVVYGDYAQAMGEGVTARHRAEHVFGQYNSNEESEAAFDERGDFVEIVGNGTSFSNLSNARTLDWSGNEALAGSLTLGKGTADEVTITAAQLTQLLALLN